MVYLCLLSFLSLAELINNEGGPVFFRIKRNMAAGCAAGNGCAVPHFL